MWRTSARVSTSVIAGTPQSRQPVQPAALGAGRVLGVHRGAHDHRARPDALGLHRLGADAVVADVRVGERDDLVREARVGDGLLVARHAGREDDLAGGRVRRAAGDAVEARAVLEQDVGARMSCFGLRSSQARTSGRQDEHDRALAVGDRAGRDRQQHAPPTACARRSSSSPSGSHSRYSPTTHSRAQVDEHEVRRLADRDPRDEQVDAAEARRQLLDDAATATACPAARARCRRPRTPSRGRSCPSAPARRAPPSRRARAARGRSRCSR